MTAALAPDAGWLRRRLPFLCVLLLMLFSFAPWPWVWLHAALYPLPFLAVCYWVTHRPDVFTMRSSFLAGCVQDLLSGHLFGLMAFSFLLADVILRGQQKKLALGGFGRNWLMVGQLSFLVASLQWALARFFMHINADYPAMLLQWLPGLLLYPPLARLFPFLLPDMHKSPRA